MSKSRVSRFASVGAVIAATMLPCLSLSSAFGQYAADSIFFNLVEKPTRNTNVFGTTFDGSGYVSDWGSNYMLYELQMSIPGLNPSPYYFDHMYVQVVANKGNQNTNPANPLRFALFNEDPIVGTLSDQYALATTTINQAAVSPTFTQYLLGPSGTGSGIPVNDTASNYWLVVYAGGSVANQGYGLKVDSVLKEVEFYDNTAEVVDVKYFGGEPPSFQTAQPFVPVPEPSTFALSGLGAGVLIAVAAARRRTARTMSGRPGRAAC